MEIVYFIYTINVFIQYGESPLHFAVCHDHKETVELLLASGARGDLQDQVTSQDNDSNIIYVFYLF